jgi:hypothetical protein
MKNFHMKVELINYWLPLAKQEDHWDNLITAQVMQREDTVKWVDAIYLADGENQRAYDAELAKNKEITAKMQKIVDLETELALKEGQTIIRGRKNKPISVTKPPLT